MIMAQINLFKPMKKNEFKNYSDKEYVELLLYPVIISSIFN